MSISNIIILAAAILLAVIIFRFVTKIIIKIIAVVLVLAAVVYFLFFYNGGIVDLPSSDKYIIEQMQQKYCYEKSDTAICDCVVNIIKNDIEMTYSTEEILDFKEDQAKALEAVLKSYNKNRTDINECLEEYDRGYSVEKFREDLDALDLGTKLKNLVEKLTTHPKDGE